MKSEIQFIVFIFFPPWEKLTQYLYQGRYSTTANPKKKKEKEIMIDSKADPSICTLFP